ncbi:MAG TPA: hypothetical protein ENI06_00935 [Spirochaetales bacterium]|nr:hypothetical protein [Spirochaetales bacterium]
MSNLRKRLAMSPERLKEINDFILAEDNKLVSDLIEIVEKYGGPEQINRKSIVRQPYNRRQELVEVSKEVPNISAKHEGADPEIDAEREHPSDILEYFLPKEEILERGLMEALEHSYLDKHNALNETANALPRAGIGVIAAANIH